MVYTKLQKELFVWFKNNFWINNPQLSLKQQLIGIIEEHGELCHSILKKHQNIRLTEKHDDNIKDAIGDILVYTVNAFSIIGVDLSSIQLNDEDTDKIFEVQFNNYFEKEIDVFDILFMLHTKINDLIYDCNTIIDCEYFNDVYKLNKELNKVSCENCIKYQECFYQDKKGLIDDFIFIFYLLDKVLIKSISGYDELVSTTTETMSIYRITAEKIMKRDWVKHRSNAGDIDNG